VLPSYPQYIYLTNWTGNRTTELIAACAFNDTANGVGPFSFTNALISQLRKLAHLPSFTVGYLYNLIFTEIQNWRVDDPRQKKAPVHIVLTTDPRLPRSIAISSQRSETQHLPQQLISTPGPSLQKDAPGPTSSSSPSPSETEGATSPFSSNGASSTSSVSELPEIPEYPRLLFSIRLSEDIKPRQLSTELFAEWLGTVPIAAKSVRIEAGFASDSTLLMLSIPTAMMAYVQKNPAITMLGTTRYDFSQKKHLVKSPNHLIIINVKCFKFSKTCL